MRRLILAGLFAIMLCDSYFDGQAGPPKKPEATPAHVEVHADPEKIRAHVKFLASDLLQGRGTGQWGGDIAAEYIATQFALYGLKPAGDEGTYFQDVPMIEVKTLPETSFNVVAQNLEVMTLKNTQEFVTNNEGQTETAYIDAPMVFVGYGINAPEYSWDDYKGVDLKGKVALLFIDEPASNDTKFFKGRALTYGGWSYKFEETARRGAMAAIIIHRPDLAGYSWELVQNSWGKERSYLVGNSGPKLQAASWLQYEAARKLVAMAGLNLDDLYKQAQSKDFRPVELPLRLQARVASQVRPFVARNVLAALPARGATSQEAVLYTAHYDHLGIDPGMKGHNIYNGTVDNSTGCSVLLEIARVWSETTIAPPRRTILFAALTAEEQGLLGSEYLAKHSPVPPGKISLDLNYDTLVPIGDPEEVDVSRAERTTFYSAVQAKARSLQLAILREPRSGAGGCHRSDFTLARAGIPSFSISEGSKFKGHDAAWGETQERDYIEHRYHRPADEYIPGMDFTGATKLATFGYELGAQAASQSQLVGWLPGDEFEGERRRSQALDRKSPQPPRKGQRHKM